MDLFTVCSKIVGCRGNAFSSWVVTVIRVIPVSRIKWRRFGGRVNDIVVACLCAAKPMAPIILMVGDPNSKVSFQLLIVALGFVTILSPLTLFLRFFDFELDRVCRCRDAG